MFFVENEVQILMKIVFTEEEEAVMNRGFSCTPSVSHYSLDSPSRSQVCMDSSQWIFKMVFFLEF